MFFSGSPLMNTRWSFMVMSCGLQPHSSAQWLSSLNLASPTARRQALPPRKVTREPKEPASQGVAVVSDWMSLTSSMRRPSSSATIMVMTVSQPWPMSFAPE